MPPVQMRPRYAFKELLYPERKPRRPVRIDWSNPLTKGLRVAMYAQGGSVTDLVSQVHPTYIGASTEWSIRVRDDEGVVFSSDGTDNNTQRYEADGVYGLSDGTGDFTVITLGANTFAGSNNSYFTSYEAVNQHNARGRIYIRTIFGDIEFYTNENFATTGNTQAHGLSGFQAASICGRRTGTSLETFVNGVSIGSTSGTLRDVNFQHDTEGGHAIHGPDHDETTDPWQAYALYFDGALPDEVIRKFANDPYHWLRPV